MALPPMAEERLHNRLHPAEANIWDLVLSPAEGLSSQGTPRVSHRGASHPLHGVPSQPVQYTMPFPHM